MQHVIVIKRSLHEQFPWLARSITKAFASSLEYAYDAITERSALRYILPWLQDHLEETHKCVHQISETYSVIADLCLKIIRAFGTNRYWEDGLEKNRHVIAKFLEYSYGQGLAKKLWKPEEVGQIPFTTC
jgi:4,5-dihydroxyphthalate decarboxylase